MAIKYLTQIVLTKIKNSSITNISHLNKYKQLNPKNAPYNMLPKPTQIAQIKG